MHSPGLRRLPNPPPLLFLDEWFVFARHWACTQHIFSQVKKEKITKQPHTLRHLHHLRMISLLYQGFPIPMSDPATIQFIAFLPLLHTLKGGRDSEIPFHWINMQLLSLVIKPDFPALFFLAKVSAFHGPEAGRLFPQIVSLRAFLPSFSLKAALMRFNLKFNDFEMAEVFLTQFLNKPRQ